MAIGAEQAAYLIAEHEGLMAEKQSLLEGIDRDRTFGLVSTGAFWAWFLSNTPRWGTAFAPIVLLVLVGILAYKRFHFWKAVCGIAAYVRLVEKEMNLPTDLGWEAHLSGVPSRWGRFDWIFWGAIILANLVGVALVLWNGEALLAQAAAVTAP